MEGETLGRLADEVANGLTEGEVDSRETEAESPNAKGEVDNGLTEGEKGESEREGVGTINNDVCVPIEERTSLDICWERETLVDVVTVDEAATLSDTSKVWLGGC